MYDHYKIISYAWEITNQLLVSTSKQTSLFTFLEMLFKALSSSTLPNLIPAPKSF